MAEHQTMVMVVTKSRYNNNERRFLTMNALEDQTASDLPRADLGLGELESCAPWVFIACSPNKSPITVVSTCALALARVSRWSSSWYLRAETA